MSIKTTFKIKKDGETFRVFDNEQMIMQGFFNYRDGATWIMELHGKEKGIELRM